MLQERYPEPPNQVGVLGADRIWLTLRSREFLPNVILVMPEDISGVADKVFDDVHHEFHKKLGTIDNVLTFDSEKSNNSDVNYVKSYDNHSVSFPRLSIPEIEILTGNRGNAALHERQRQKYFDFVNQVYGLFLSKAARYRMLHEMQSK